MGTLIKEYRKKNSLTQFEFAYRIGVSEFYIGAIERGEKTPGRKTLVKLSNELDVPIEELLDYNSKYKLRVETNTIYSKLYSLTNKQQELVISIMNDIISFFEMDNNKD